MRPVAILMTVCAATAFATALAACARPVKTAGLAEAAPPQGDTTSVVLEIDNHNWSDINVYILHDGRRHRFTTVTATKDVSLVIPRSLQGETGVFRLAVYRIGGRDSFTSEPISTRTGYTIRLTVESDLKRSSVGVW
jgi:hypothetical protein